MPADIDRYLARCEASGLAPNTLRGYRSRLHHFAASCPGDLAELKTTDIEDYLDVALAGMKLSSKGTALSALSSYFNYLQKRGQVQYNPCAGVKLASRPRRRPTYYTPAQAAALIHVGTPRNQLLAALALRHGQRAGAIVRLRWADIDWSAATATYSPWKSSSTMRLPLDVDLAKRLRAWRALHPEAEWVFTGNHGQHLSYAAARLGLIAQCKLAGVPYRGLHELRRTCVTTLLQAEVPLHVVSRQVAGHASVRTTVDFYAGADDESVAAAIRRLPY